VNCSRKMVTEVSCHLGSIAAPQRKRFQTSHAQHQLIAHPLRFCSHTVSPCTNPVIGVDAGLIFTHPLIGGDTIHTSL